MLSRRFVKFGVAIGVSGLALSSLHKNHWEVSTVGLLRFGRAAVTVSKIACDYKFTLHGFDKNSKEYDEAKSEVHYRSAQKLLELCRKNGGVFIKVGQHIGALNYLLPYEYVSTLSVLHNRAPKASLDDVFAVIKEDLGQHVNDIFTEFDPEPVGAASLAQVHKAKLKDGSEVAVKVQHRRVKAHSMVDMATMEVLVNIVAWLFPDFTFLWLADETKRNLPLELDFLHEGKCAERVGRMFSKFLWLKVPKIHWNLSTSRVLTMEYCDGGQVNDKQYIEKHNISANDVSKKLAQLYSEMIFVEGYVHCDPHPGNILVQKDVKSNSANIVLLDHGLYVTLTDEFRINYCNLWMALIAGNVKEVEHWARKLNVGDMFGLLACMVTARSWNAVKKGIENHSATTEEKNEIRQNAAMYFPQITFILSQVPREMLLILKTNDLLRGIETTLGVKGAAGSFIEMSRCCVKAVYNQKLLDCHSYFHKTTLRLMRYISLAKINLYKLFLGIRNWFGLPFDLGYLFRSKS